MIARSSRLRHHVLLCSLGLLVAFGVVVRLMHPDRAYVWLDEVWTAMHSTGHSLMDVLAFTEQTKLMTAGEFLPFMRHDDRASFGTFIDTDPHTSPLYYTLSAVAIKIVGDHVAATRLLSALCGCLALGCVYLTGREIAGGRLGGALALVLSAVSPLQISGCYESRPYSLWLATIGLSTYAFLRATAEPRGWRWGFYAGSGALLLYSHLYGVFVLLAHAAHLAAGGVERRIWWRFAGALSAAALAVLPWCLAILSRLDVVEGLTGWQSHPAPASDIVARWQLMLLLQFGATAALDRIPFGATIITLLAVVIPPIALVRSWREGQVRTTAMLGVMLVSLPGFLLIRDLIEGGQRVGVTRYYIAGSFAVVFIIAGFAASLARQWQAGAASLRTHIGLALTALLVVTSASGAWTQFRARVPEGKPHPFIVSMADAIANAHNPVVLSAGLVTMPLILANHLAPTTPVYSLRWHDISGPQLTAMAPERTVFVLEPAPDIYEPRRQEAMHIIERLSTRFRLARVVGTCCMYQLFL